MLDYIKKHIVVRVVIIVLLFLIIVIPIVVHCLFKIHPQNAFFEAVWSAGDILTYCSAILSFLATTFLSALAIWQTHQIKLESDKHDKKIEELERKRIKPFIIIESQKDKNDGGIKIALSNMSYYLAKRVRVSNLVVICRGDEVDLGREKDTGISDEMTNQGRIKWRSDKKYEIRYLVPNEIESFALGNPELHQDETISFELRYEDIYGNEYKFCAYEESRTDSIPNFELAKVGDGDV